MPETKPTRFTFLSFLLSCFTWFKPAIQSRRTLKTWFRCCLVLAITMVLVVDTDTSTTMGLWTFFAALVAMMLPPALTITLFVIAGFTVLIGMLSGWAIGCAAMVSGLAARSPELLAKQQEQVAQFHDPSTPPALQVSLAINKGMFLDPRTSAVYGVFMFFGAYAFGAIRACIPNLTLLCLFGSAILDIICTYGPLYPTAQYLTFTKLFLVPAGAYMAIAMASIIFIFPETMNGIWLTTLQTAFLEPAHKILYIQSEALASQPSDRKSWAARTKAGTDHHRTLVAGVQNLEGQIQMIELEFSIGRLGPADLAKICRELKSLMLKASGLHSFQSFVNDMNACDEKEEDILGRMRINADRHFALRQLTREREAKFGHDLDTLVPILAETSADLRAVCERGVKVVEEWFTDCNNDRWRGFFAKPNKNQIEERHQKLVEELSKVHESLNQFRKTKRVNIVQPFERFFDPSTGRLVESINDRVYSSEMFAARSLFICFVFSDSLDAFAEGLATILALLVKLDGKRPTPRLWIPSGFGKITRKLLNKYNSNNRILGLSGRGITTNPLVSAPGDSGKHDGDEEERLEYEEGDTESDNTLSPRDTPPRKARYLTKVLGTILNFFRSAEGIFALRHAVISTALFIPAVCPTSAWTYSKYRGLWALIMAQAALSVYAGDQIVAFFVRTLGTLIGLVVGMVAWYIGAGLGNGNAYGVVISTTAAIAPFLFCMLGAPSEQSIFWAMITITASFVAGFSWADSHVPQLINTGVGIEIGWQRALLVIIGFTSAAIVMMFPRPTSSRTLVRRTLSTTSEELGQLFADVIEAFIAEETRARRGQYEEIKYEGEDVEKISLKERRTRTLAKKIFAVSARLQGLASPLQMARFEHQVQGQWCQEKYELLHETQMKMLSSLILLIGAFSRLDTQWCSILVQRTPFLNPNLLSDIFSNIALLSHALSGTHPIPASLPWLRDRVIYHEHYSTQYMGHPAPSNFPEPSKKMCDSDSGTTETEKGSMNIDSADLSAETINGSIGFKELSLPILTDDKLPPHASAVVALSSIISLIDDMSAIIRSLCGETSFRGFGALERDYLDKREKAVGGGPTEKFQQWSLWPGFESG